MTLRNWLRAVALLSIWGAGSTLPLAFAAESAPTARVVAPEAEICKGCHEQKVTEYANTLHAQKGNTRGPDCQTCHGDATEHIKAGGGKGVGGILGFGNKKIPAAKKAAVCLTCHENNRNLAFWDSGKHKLNDVSCDNCHSLHGRPSGGANVALKAGVPVIGVMTTTTRQLEHETCMACHKDKRAQFNKPSHHPLVEGKIKCSDCHNPHGALNPVMVKFESTNDLCLSCHVDKRGPWIHEHPPVQENCAICHQPHGSNHQRLLAFNPPEMCNECHRSGASSVGGHSGTTATGQSLVAPLAQTAGTQRFMARGCVNCHRQIHGSNAAGGTPFGSAFVR